VQAVPAGAPRHAEPHSFQLPPADLQIVSFMAMGVLFPLPEGGSEGISSETHPADRRVATSVNTRNAFIKLAAMSFSPAV
jgi:hypothetical protein